MMTIITLMITTILMTITIFMMITTTLMTITILMMITTSLVPTREGAAGALWGWGAQRASQIFQVSRVIRNYGIRSLGHWVFW